MIWYVRWRKCSPVRRSPSYKSLLGKFLLIGSSRATWRRRCGHALCVAVGWLLVGDSTPLLQTKAWRAPRPEGSVRQRAAARTPNFSVPHVSSSVSKAPISVHRYCCFLATPVTSRQAVAAHLGPLYHHEAANANCQAKWACVGAS